jgi:hypothetical protein
VGLFGEKLRKYREQRGLEIDDISNVTKISVRMLRALEEEHFDQLPGGVFNRGFVRAYARQVGLDQEEAVADYAAALRESLLQQSILPDLRTPDPELTFVATPDPIKPDREPDADQVLETAPENILPSADLPAGNHKNEDDGNVQNPEPQNLESQSQGPQVPELRPEDRRNQNQEDRRNEDRRNQARRDEDRRRLHQTQARAANPLTSRFRQKYPAGTPTEPVAESSVEVPWGKLAVALLLVTLTLAFWNFRPHAQPAASHSVASPNQSPAPVSTPASSATQLSAPASSPRVETPSLAGTQSTATSSPAPNSAATAPHPTPASASTASSPDAEPNFKPRVTHAAAPKPPATFTLLIRADQTTWVSLMVDGKPAARETLIAPAHTSVRATHDIVVKTGNAASISFQLNGKPIPAQGHEGEAITYLVDATSVHVIQ